MRKILITIIDEDENGNVDKLKNGCFEGDELTSAECQAIIWLREQQKDLFDNE